MFFTICSVIINDRWISNTYIIHNVLAALCMKCSKIINHYVRACTCIRCLQIRKYINWKKWEKLRCPDVAMVSTLASDLGVAGSIPWQGWSFATKSSRTQGSPSHNWYLALSEVKDGLGTVTATLLYFLTIWQK